MIKKEKHIDAPAIGCKVGQAYQIMVRQLAQALEKAGLDITVGEYLILRAVYSCDGLQQCEIADRVGKDKAAVCRTISVMEKKGLLSTMPVSHKCLKVFLTPKSLSMEAAICEVASRRHKALSELITPERLELFSEILDKIINSK